MPATLRSAPQLTRYTLAEVIFQSGKPVPKSCGDPVFDTRSDQFALDFEEAARGRFSCSCIERTQEPPSMYYDELPSHHVIVDAQQPESWDQFHPAGMVLKGVSSAQSLADYIAKDCPPGCVALFIALPLPFSGAGCISTRRITGSGIPIRGILSPHQDPGKIRVSFDVNYLIAQVIAPGASALPNSGLGK